MTLREQILAEIRLRARRHETLPADLFGEPAWDILLDLALARIDRRKMQASSAYVAGDAAPTTGLRYATLLLEAGLVERIPDRFDTRRVWLSITDEGLASVAACFEQTPAFVGNSNFRTDISRIRDVTVQPLSHGEAA